MKGLAAIVSLVVAVVCPGAAAQSTLFISPDVPTTAGAFTTFQPSDVVRHASSSYDPTPALTIPDGAAIDAVHKLDAAGHWLFSVEAPTDLAGMLPAFAEPRDVIRRDDSGAFAPFFCGGNVIGSIPPGTNVDAVYLEGGDDGDLIVSLDVPVTIDGTPVEPADLIRYSRTGASCSSWTLVGFEFDASAAGKGLAVSTNLIGADRVGRSTLMVFDVPTEVASTSGPLTIVSGQVVAWDGTSFELQETLGGWPAGSLVNALSCQANPGRVGNSLRVDKSSLTAGDLRLSWQASCSAGAEDHAIYEGRIPSYYSHRAKDCNDGGADGIEELTPIAASSYYIVVPHNIKEEGSYGRATGNVERPRASGPRCGETLVLTPCP